MRKLSYWLVAAPAAILLMTTQPLFAQGGINMAAEGTDQLWRGEDAGSHAGAWLDQGAMNTSDPRRDLIIGAPGSATTIGRVYIIFGGPHNTGTFELSAANGVFNGAAAGDLFGTSTAAGNIVTLEGSTFRDLAIGAPGALSGRGAVYVYTGGVDQGDSTPTTSRRIEIRGATGDRLGTSLATADLDNDNYREVIIGAPGTSRVYVIRGGPAVSGVIDLSVTSAMSVITGPGIGRQVIAGDVTGEGTSDILISAQFEDGNKGRVYIVNGRAAFPSSVVLPGAASAQLIGVNPDDQAGAGLRLGDFDGDGIRDVFVGAPGADPAGRPDAGAVYVFWGGPTLSPASPRSAANANRIIYGEVAGFRTGAALESGDINRDTPNDLVMLAAGARGGAGELHVIYGGLRSNLPATIDLAGGMARRMFADPSAGPLRSAAVFEVTGEGARDIIVGVPNAATPAGAEAGVLYFSLSPKLVLASNSLTFAAVQGTSTQRSVQVLNPGIGNVSWSATSNLAGLQVSPVGEATASNPGLLTVATADTLGPGTYTATVTVKSTSPHLEMSKFLTVTFTVRSCAVGGRGASDFNGDSCADLVVFRPSSGDWFVQDQGTFRWGLPTDVPVPGDYDGNGTTDIAVYRPSSGIWYVFGQSGIQYGLPGDVPVPADYNGDGRMDIAVYRPSTRTWHVRDQFSVQYGLPNDTPVPGDYDGDGRADLAVYRRSSGMWFVRDVLSVKWGGPGYLPVPADYNGDGRTDVAVFGNASGNWHVKDQFTAKWGQAGDLPIPLDRDGDGSAELVVFRASSNTWFIFSMARGTNTTENWGGTGDVPAVLRPPVLSSVPGDADGDRKADLVIWRPGTGDWWMTYNATTFSTYNVYRWGASSDTPLAGDYDGDGRLDLIVFRPSIGTWFIKLSSTGYNDWAPNTVFGASADTPVPGDYIGTSATQLAYWRPTTGMWVVNGGPSMALGASGDVPAPADYDGDGRTDMAVFRPSTGQWMIRRSSLEFASILTTTFGASSDTPVPADFDGDGRADLAYWRPSTGTWHILQSSIGTVVSYAWGSLGTDVPVPGDFNGDGRADVAVWRPGTGIWYVREQFNQKWGQADDVPVIRRD
jgi:hypothetical protein